MNRLLSWILTRSDTHLTDEQIIADLESAPSGLPSGAGRHLRSCWRCLARRQQLQSITFQIVAYQQAILTPFLPPPPSAEERFLRRLDQEAAPTASLARPALHLSLLSIPGRIPVLAGACAVVIAVLFALVTHLPVAAPMTAAEFLQQAVSADEQPSAAQAGVVTQRVRIQSSSQTIERTLYRDLQGVRHPRNSRASLASNALRSELTTAGVDWNDPLSAASFASWHDRAVVQDDHVAPSRENLLTLTTEVKDREVASESLTVRQQDFHPVARTIHLRDAETIEIAEVDYSVSGWSAATEAAFDPVTAIQPAATKAMVPSALPTVEELDAAELRARLAAGQGEAPSSEELEFTRTVTGVHVRGAVATNERRHELLVRLQTIPHVTANIFSIEELQASHLPELEATPTSRSDTTVETSKLSPLSTWFQQRSRSQKEADASAREILAAMSAVQQESSALSEVLKRFAPNLPRDRAAEDSLEELLRQHRQRLNTALEQEEQLIRPFAAGNGKELSAAGAGTSQARLAEATARNRALCNELLMNSPSSSRPAAEIAANILNSLDDIRRHAGI